MSNKTAETLSKEERTLTLIDAIIRNRKAAYSDMLDSLITVIATLVIIFIIPIVLKTYFIGNINVENIMGYVQIPMILILIYISFSRIGFMIWDSIRVLSFTIKTLNKGEGSIEYRKYKRAVTFYNLLSRENKLIRRLISIVSLGITLLYIQSTPYLKIVVEKLDIPKPFSTNPILILLPIYVLLIFLIAYIFPVLSAVRNSLNEFYDELESEMIISRFEVSKCPICGSRIPSKSIHCPFCGALIEKKEKSGA